MTSHARETRATWLGQAGFRLEGAGRQILIDPFLSPHPRRLVEPPEDTDTLLSGVDALLVTHEHVDHFDRQLLGTLADHSPRATVVVPEGISRLARGLTTLEVRGVRPGETTLVRGIEITATPATHPTDVMSPEDPDDVRCTGFLVDVGTGVQIYHAGDTLVTEELLRFLGPRRIDAALLPINGRDYFRERDGIVGNMSIREAVGLAVASDVGLLVPMHWDMMRGNTERVGSLVDEAMAVEARFHVLVPRRGIAIDLACASSSVGRSTGSGADL